MPEGDAAVAVQLEPAYDKLGLPSVVAYYVQEPSSKNGRKAKDYEDPPMTAAPMTKSERGCGMSASRSGGESGMSASAPHGEDQHVSGRYDLRCVIGRAAQDTSRAHMSKLVAPKAYFGRPFDANEAVSGFHATQLHASDGDMPSFVMGDLKLFPEQAIVELFKVIYDRVVDTLQGTRKVITGDIEAVVTCPAYFDQAQRVRLKACAKKAGITCEYLLNEPTAAAVNYGLQNEQLCVRRCGSNVAFI